MITQALGFFTPWIIYALITVLHYFLPGRWVTVYVKHSETGELLKYRLNGRLVLIMTILIWFVLGYINWVPLDWLYTIRWYSLAGAFVFTRPFCKRGLFRLLLVAVVSQFYSPGHPFVKDALC